MTGLSWATLSTPVGPMSVGCSKAGVARVRFAAPPILSEQERAAAGRGRPTHPAAEFAAAARAELIEYFRGDRRVFEVPVDWSATAGPQRQVLTVLAETVGYGQTISYGALARRAGRTDEAPEPAATSRGDDPPKPPEAIPARAVGTIMASNPIPVLVPCHRVLASDGLGGYSGGAGIEVKRWLLILEGSQPPTLDWAAGGASGSRCPG